MNLRFILIFFSILYFNNALISDEKVKKIQDKFWEIHYNHANTSYTHYKEILEKYKNDEYDDEDILREFKYFPYKTNITVHTIKAYIDRVYNFTYHDATCYLCFERAKRWYWLTYEKDY